jgi:hypothetical protein|tara:strand:- start:307 stop:534 length:228 start_codon:yes stop_codon:yes gene_type:complete
MKKVTKKELESLQTLVKHINQAQLAVGTLELQKQNAVLDAQGLISKLRMEKQLLEKKYDGQEIDIMTGGLTNATN